MKKKILMLVCAFCFVIPAVLFGLTACGTKKPKEIGLQYKLINNGSEYSVVGLGNYDKTTLSIPATYKNKPVTRVEVDAFEDCQNLTSITIPESVTSIGSDAFRGCSSLETVKYTGDINDWVSIDFANNKANPLFGVKLIINNEVVTTANITTTEIKPFAFISYSYLENVNFQNGVSSIGKYAFYNCARLTSITMLNTVTKIGRDAFSNSSHTIDVEFVGNINDWVSIDFYNEDANPLSCGGDLKINNEIVTTANITTTEIKPYAFYGYGELISVNLGSGVTRIGVSAFEACSQLNSIEISSSVTTIGDYAFFRCYDIQLTVTIDSETVANALIEDSSMGNLVDYAPTVYVKAGLSVSNSTYLLLNFTKEATSDKDGYDMYVKNAE